MHATAPQGFMNLNAGGVWPSFTLQDMSIGSHGELSLNKTGSAYASAGVFMGGPFRALDGATPWYRFALRGHALPPGSHLQIFTWTGGGAAPPFFPLDIVPFPGWQAAPRDAFEGVIFNPAAPDLWIGGVVRSDGTSTPALHQIRIDYGRDTYLKHLPGIYRADPPSSDLLSRLLSLAETSLGSLLHEIIDLTRLFDPAAAPNRGFPSWLSWLSGWLAWEIDQNWTEAQMRQCLAEAFSLYSLRGTIEGLRRYLKIYAGVNAHITEPSRNTTIWSLGSNSSLGFSTMLAPASAAGAILDGTSVLDASDLTAPDDPFGSALFDDVAYRFQVEINAGELTRVGAIDSVRAVIDREKPAHTICDLCVIHPRMRVGSQCRVGIDAIIGREREAQIGAPLGHAVLAAADRECKQEEVSYVH